MSFGYKVNRGKLLIFVVKRLKNYSRSIKWTFKRDGNIQIFFKGILINALLNVAPGRRMPMTGVGVSFLPVRVFTQQLLKKAKSKQPNPN